MKRAVWDYEVQVRVAKARDTGASSAQPEVICFSIQDLLRLQFFANMPVPEDEDVVKVDLVRACTHMKVLQVSAYSGGLCIKLGSVAWAAAISSLLAVQGLSTAHLPLH